MSYHVFTERGQSFDTIRQGFLQAEKLPLVRRYRTGFPPARFLRKVSGLIRKLPTSSRVANPQMMR